jgi:hypothetical protein
MNSTVPGTDSSARERPGSGRAGGSPLLRHTHSARKARVMRSHRGPASGTASSVPSVTRTTARSPSQRSSGTERRLSMPRNPATKRVRGES